MSNAALADVTVVPDRAPPAGEVLALLGASRQRAQLWDWQFDAGNADSARPIVAYAGDGSVIGFNGVMPVRVLVDGQQHRACWSCDFVVHPDYRGTGLAQRIKAALHQEQARLMTFGVSPAAAKVLERIGWCRGEGVYNFRYLRTGTGAKRRAWRAAQWVHRLIGYPMRCRMRHSPLSVSVSTLLPDRSEVDALWTAAASGYRRIVFRDYDYLEWRYRRCPVGQYRFIAVREAGRLKALGVYRNQTTAAWFVDLLAEAGDQASRYLIIDTWLKSQTTAQQASVVASDKTTARVLRAFGFCRSRDRPRFFVRTSRDDDPAPGRDWFLMAGDSDGEFLRAAREAAVTETLPDATTGSDDKAPSSPVELDVLPLSEAESFGNRALWDDLMARSDADPLFMGWAWQSAWWVTWRDRLGLKPWVLGVYHGGMLVGLMPLYRYRSQLAGAVSVEELHFPGNAWHIAPTVRTEYIDVIADRRYRDAVQRELTAYLRRCHWDVMVVCDHASNDSFTKHLTPGDAVTVVRKEDAGVAIDTTGDFDQWLYGLGRNTRLKAYNRRRLLADGDGFRVEQDTARGLALLNRFHEQRWGNPCFSGASLAFHETFLARCDGDYRVQFSRLDLGGAPRSLLYDITIGGRSYNLQAGFDDQYDNRMSLGTLHLGFAIERAFGDPSVHAYDLLAGGGKNTFYKAHLNGTQRHFVTQQLLRRRLLRVGYAGYSRLPGWLRRRALRFLPTL